MDALLKEYINLYKKMKYNDRNCIPLCAAETYISEFVKQPLNSEFEGKYYFFEGNKITELKNLITEACNQLFHSKYANAESLSGINCFTVCAMSLLKSREKVLLSTPEQGGHASMPIILDTLNVSYDSIPYDFNKYQIDYINLNKMCATGEYSFIILCQSDLINVPDLSQMDLPSNMGIIYDATQTLGLISGGCIANPLEYPNVVLLGGTHKTLPAVACGLIMTNTDLYIEKLSSNITPNYLRDIQPNHMAGLLLSLIEQMKYGNVYQHTTVSLANRLGKKLENYGFSVAKINEDAYTMTHQLFLLMEHDEADSFYNQALNYNISLNQKHKQLFHDDGIRLGTQYIARFNWDENDLNILAKLLFYVKNKESLDKIKPLRKELIAKKIPHFTFNEIIIE